jgi:predicted acyltransferase
MPAATQVAEELAVEKARRPEAAARLVSLDAYRGFIMLLLISHGFGLSAMSAYPGFEWLAAQVDHAAWEGVTFWDLIQPAFTFMVGVAMPYAFARRLSEGASRSTIFRHVLWRAAMLIALSNVLSNFGGKPRPVLQLINVLCQIAFGYVICFAIMQLRLRWQFVAGAALAAGYWALFLLFPGTEGPFSKTDNIGALIDKAVLGYNYSGFYTTINFLGNALTILFGCWTGMLLLKDRPHSYKLKAMTAAAAAGLAGGLLLELVCPMVKRLWTLSFTLYSAGWVMLMLIGFYVVVEVRGMRGWTFPFIVLGMNSIFIYSFSQVLRGWLDRGIGVFTGRFWYLGPLGAIPQNLAVLTVMWFMCYWLYRRKIFFRI